MTLAERLRAGSLRHRDRHLLTSPWVCPSDAAFAPSLRSASVTETRALCPGETLLLSVDPSSASQAEGLAMAWTVDGPESSSLRRAELACDARESWLLARTCAAQGLQSVVHPEEAIAGGRQPPEAQFLVATASNSALIPSMVAGRSFGLAFALAEASRLLGEPLPASVVASCAVISAGKLESVDGLDAKLRLVFGWLLGVERVLVHESQCAEANAILGALASQTEGRCVVTAVGVSSLREAFDLVFPDIRGKLRARWRHDRELAERAAAGLFRLALDNGPVSMWSGAANAADDLESVLSGAPLTLPARHAAVARVILRRHEGASLEVLPREDPLLFESLYLPDRLKLAAHVVQSATDGSSAPEELAGVIAWATTPSMIAAEPRERTHEHVRLGGAIGRAYAALRRYDEAAQWLDESIESWMAVHQPDEASYPLCERLRIAGIRRERDVLLRLASECVPRVRHFHRSTFRTVQFLDVAVLRAYVQAGLDDEARAWLRATCDPAWASAEPWVHASWLRWKARHFDGKSPADEARAARDEARTRAGDDEASVLVTLDEVLDAKEPSGIREALERLAATPQGLVDITRLRRLAPRATDDEFARLVAEEWRY